MPVYLAGIDIGTTGTRAAIFDLKGNIVSSAYKEYKCLYPKPNWIEQNPEDLIKHTFSVIKETVYNPA